MKCVPNEMNMKGDEVGFNKIALLAVICIAIGLPIIFAEPAFAATPVGVTNVENFIKSLITVLAGLAGLVATGFFVAGGFTYIMSSGNPDQLEKAKRTLTWSAVGLAIVIAAFVFANIITSLATQAFGA